MNRSAEVDGREDDQLTTNTKKTQGFSLRLVTDSFTSLISGMLAAY